MIKKVARQPLVVAGLAALSAVALVVVGIWKKQDVVLGAGLVMLTGSLSGWVQVALTDAHRRRNDEDETRRIIYMAILVGSGSTHAELAGSIVNTLVHHAADPVAVGDALVNVDGALRGKADSATWLALQAAQFKTRT